MRARGWLAAAVFLAACGVAEVESDRAVFFGDLAIGEQRDVALLLVNSGDAPVTLAFETSSAEFTPLEPSRTLAAGASSSVLLRFSPTDLGPRTGKLIIASSLGRSWISLSGRGTGPRLTAPAQVWLAGCARLGTGRGGRQHDAHAAEHRHPRLAAGAPAAARRWR